MPTYTCVFECLYFKYFQNTNYLYFILEHLIFYFIFSVVFQLTIFLFRVPLLRFKKKTVVIVLQRIFENSFNTQVAHYLKFVSALLK